MVSTVRSADRATLHRHRSTAIPTSSATEDLEAESSLSRRLAVALAGIAADITSPQAPPDSLAGVPDDVADSTAVARLPAWLRRSLPDHASWHSITDHGWRWRQRWVSTPGLIVIVILVVVFVLSARAVAPSPTDHEQARPLRQQNRFGLPHRGLAPRARRLGVAATAVEARLRRARSVPHHFGWRRDQHPAPRPLSSVCSARVLRHLHGRPTHATIVVAVPPNASVTQQALASDQGLLR